MKYRIILSLLVMGFVFNLVIMSCNKNDVQQLVADTGEAYTAGLNGTVSDETSNALGNAVPNLSSDDNNKFIVGNSFNRNAWVTAPSSTTGRDGLGPLFNANACASCHILDGRGRPPEPGEDPIALIFRLSMPGDIEVPNYGKQFQNHGINGVKEEGKVVVNYTEVPGSYPDGTAYSLRKPAYQFTNLQYGDFPAGYMFSPRIAPQMSGAGNFDAVPDEAILSGADPSDADGDGISGKVNHVLDHISNSMVIGRHGWKCNTATIANQVADAFSNDIGVTSRVFPKPSLSGIEADMYNGLPNGGDPEIQNDFYDDVVYYTTALAMPQRRKNFADQDVLTGKKLFINIGCAKCHSPELQTGTNALVPQLSNQTIRPYTDLLLHDLGDGLADNRPDGEASGSEWRTAPLWGMSYSQTVNKHTFLLHDGRARNAEEAILWHAGESTKIIDAFKALAKTDREKILKFLETL